MRRILVLALVLILALSLITACSSKDNNPSGGGSDVTTAKIGNNPKPTDDSNDIDPTDNTNNNNSGDLTGRLISGRYSIIYPEGWTFKNNDGDHQANDPNSNAFIQITTMGMTAEAYFKLMGGADDLVDVKMGAYTFKRSGTDFGTAAYAYEHNPNSTVLITVYQVDDALVETSLMSFKITD